MYIFQKKKEKKNDNALSLIFRHALERLRRCVSLLDIRTTPAGLRAATVASSILIPGYSYLATTM